MTVTEPSAAHPPLAPAGAGAFLAQSRAVTVRDVIAVRRAADILASMPIVDPSRIGYLGWSAGAKTGAFVAASDRRFKALVLLSGGADKLAAFVAAAPARLRPLVKRQLGSVDPLRYIAWASPGTLLLEDGTRDAVVPRRALLNMIRAAPRRTLVHWYPAPVERRRVSRRVRLVGDEAQRLGLIKSRTSALVGPRRTSSSPRRALWTAPRAAPSALARRGSSPRPCRPSRRRTR